MTELRISRPTLFMEIAQVVAKRSTCFRLNVGAVITVNNRIVSIGYNGPLPGQPHCAGNYCPGKLHCTLAVHAERNALNYVPPSMDDEPKDLYTTHSPCIHCTESILQRKVDKVYFSVPYRLTDHLVKIPNLFQVMPSGWVVDFHSGEVVES